MKVTPKPNGRREFDAFRCTNPEIADLVCTLQENGYFANGLPFWSRIISSPWDGVGPDESIPQLVVYEVDGDNQRVMRTYIVRNGYVVVFLSNGLWIGTPLEFEKAFDIISE